MNVNEWKMSRDISPDRGFRNGQMQTVWTLLYVVNYENLVIRCVTWQVLEGGQRDQLPGWLVWNQSLLEGVAGEADIGTDYVIMVSYIHIIILLQCDT